MTYLPALEAELRRAGVPSWSLIYGKHIKIRFTWRGRTLQFVTPMSPSDVRGQRNAVADLRRMLGVRLERRKSQRPAKAAAKSVERAPVLLGAAVPDWREKLATLRGTK